MELKKIVLMFSVVLTGSVLSSAGFAVEDDSAIQDLFQQGIQARAGGDLEEARDSYLAILAEHPELHRARLELALSYLDLAEFQLARDNAQQVLNDPGIPPQVRITVLAFLAKVKAEEERPKIKPGTLPSFSIGFLHDNNANAGPGNIVIRIPSTNTFANAGAGEIHDNAVVANLNMPHRHSLEMTAFSGKYSAPVYWVSEANLYTRSYRNDSQYNLDVLSLITGPELAARDWQANLNVRADFIRQGSNHLASFYSVEPEVTYRIANTTLKLEGRIQARNYKRRINNDFDSMYRSIGMVVEQSLLNRDLSVMGGIRYFSEDAKNDRYNNHGDEVEVGADWLGWRNTRLYFRLSRENFDYEGVEPVVEIRRYDREDQLLMGVDYTFRKGMAKDWTLSGIYEHTRHHSNAATYDYRRDLTQISMGRYF